MARAAQLIVDALKKGNKILLCGNGGSAADAQHLAAELMGRFLIDRRPLPALALTVDTSALTAIGNDYGFADVFARQIAGIGVAGDVLLAISTSGKSENVLRGVTAAKARGIVCIGLSGETGGPLKDLCEVTICAPSRHTNHIQEMHIAVGHYICGLVEANLASPNRPPACFSDL